MRLRHRPLSRPRPPLAQPVATIFRREAYAAGARTDCPSPLVDDGNLIPNAPPKGDYDPDEGAAAGEGQGGEGEAWIGVAKSGGGVFGAGTEEGWVQLLSVTSDDPQFHPASFQPQALPPEGETSFQARRGEGGERGCHVRLPLSGGSITVGSPTHNLFESPPTSFLELLTLFATYFHDGVTLTYPAILLSPFLSLSLQGGEGSFRNEIRSGSSLSLGLPTSLLLFTCMKHSFGVHTCVCTAV